MMPAHEHMAKRRSCERTRVRAPPPTAPRPHSSQVMSKLAAAHQSVNLGQGFPDAEGPESMKRAAADALLSHHNQYPPMMGVPELRQAVARHSAREQDIPCDWASETLVTVGATEGIAAVFMGLCNAGDEVGARA